jgi:hypothetical protein
MQPKKFALIGGVLMLLMGVLALIPSLSQFQNSAMQLPMLKIDTSYGLFLGVLPFNIVNKIALILFGIAGIAAANAPTTSLPKSILFARVTFFVMGALAILGLIPDTNTLNGYIPLFGGTIIDHAVFALVGAYFGFALTTKAKTENERMEKADKTAVKHRTVGV